MSRRLLAGLFGLVSCSILGACLLTTDLDGFHDPKSATDAGPDTGKSTLTDPDAQTGVEAGGTDGGNGDAGDANVLFTDDFNRANGPVGNGWLDPKASYRIEDDHLPVNGNGWGFQANTLYQPKRADALNVKASVEYTPLSLPPNYPQVHVRAQPGDDFKCYAVGIPQDDTIFFGRCAPGGNFTDLGDQKLDENVVVGRTYRLSISTTGTSPVHLTMTLERKTDRGFMIIGQKSVDDAAAERVTEPGAFGISGDTNPNWVYDNFVITKIP